MEKISKVEMDQKDDHEPQNVFTEPQKYQIREHFRS